VRNDASRVFDNRAAIGVVLSYSVVALGPGMKVTAEIKTGKRTVISYLLSPVLRYRQESMGER
jgi:hemolysin D